MNPAISPEETIGRMADRINELEGKLRTTTIQRNMFSAKVDEYNGMVIALEATLKAEQDAFLRLVNRLTRELAAVKQENEDHERGFELRWQADMRAIKRWQEATGRADVWPDHADLCVWLMEQLDAEKAAYAATVVERDAAERREARLREAMGRIRCGWCTWHYGDNKQPYASRCDNPDCLRCRAALAEQPSEVPMTETCWICHKPKGQGQDRCAGHYEGTPTTAVPSDSPLAHLRDEEGDIILAVAGTHIGAHGATELEAWQSLHGMIALVIQHLSTSEDHPEHWCQRCGERNIAWFAPSEVWNRVDPKEGILCPTCFTADAEKLGIAPTGWKLEPETVAAPSDSGEPPLGAQPTVTEAYLNRQIELLTRSRDAEQDARRMIAVELDKARSAIDSLTAQRDAAERQRVAARGELSALKEEVKRVLEPFANDAKQYGRFYLNTSVIVGRCFTVGDLRSADALYARLAAPGTSGKEKA